jgi:threonyl-tRNA synthetase
MLHRADAWARVERFLGVLIEHVNGVVPDVACA